MEYVLNVGEDMNYVKSALFTFDDPSRYAGFLVLRRGGSRFQDGEIVLPVDARLAGRRTCLPGAPNAVAFDKPGIMNVRNISFRDGVPEVVRGKIVEFFRDENYLSVSTVVIPSREGARGVINIESSREDLLGEGEDVGRAVCRTLHPLVAILSQIM
jgi:hypothetical protein